MITMAMPLISWLAISPLNTICSMASTMMASAAPTAMLVRMLRMMMVLMYFTNLEMCIRDSLRALGTAASAISLTPCTTSPHSMPRAVSTMTRCV